MKMTVLEWIKAGMPVGLWASDPFPGLKIKKEKK